MAHWRDYHQAFTIPRLFQPWFDHQISAPESTRKWWRMMKHGAVLRKAWERWSVLDRTNSAITCCASIAFSRMRMFFRSAKQSWYNDCNSIAEAESNTAKKIRKLQEHIPKQKKRTHHTKKQNKNRERNNVGKLSIEKGNYRTRKHNQQMQHSTNNTKWHTT